MLRKLTISLAKFSRRNLSYSNVKKAILTSEFSLNKEWSDRHNDMEKLSLGGEYEWIVAVQKKFIGGGKASAVDVDAAACGAEEKDQINDILDLIYKLRHTDNASDFLPSTEYATLRLLLKHNATSEFFKILNDPINYGIFPNEHVACLAIDYFISKNDFSSAARIASIVMQQEMFDSMLLNHLSVFSLVKFIELPTEERKMNENLLVVKGPFEEDDESPTFRYPYLKSKWNDNHFDIEECGLLVSKSLKLFVDTIDYEDIKLKKSLELLSIVIGNKYEELLQFLENNEMSSFKESALNISKNICNDHLERLGEENEDEKKLLTEIISKIGDSVPGNNLLSDDIMKEFKKIQSEEEDKLINTQKVEFNLWNNHRENLLKIQAEKLNLQFRLQEINKTRDELKSKKEILFFFENRSTWELKAAEKTRFLEEMKMSL
uniref:28S ribosomal protein S27, mitochondrial n=1 Tax=Strongyloides papillosus TaxID=174720 RepID=A0A0N5BWM5_STREA